VSNERTPRYTNAKKNRPFSGLQHQAQFGLNPALASTKLFLIIDTILFKYRDKSSPVNFSEYDNLPYNIEIVDYSDVN